jgi:penicillin-binding protein 2
MSDNMMLKDPARDVRLFGGRMLVAGIFMLVLLCILLWRYYDLQINDYEKYRTQSDRNRVQLLPVPPKRGLIFDRNGNLLADNAPTFALSIIKERSGDFEQTLTILRDVLKLSDDEMSKFRQRMKRRRPYEAVPLRLRMNEEDIARFAVNRHRLPGVDVEADLDRFYPYRELFSHLIGYVGRINEEEIKAIDPVNYSGTEQIGKIGLEKFYEDQLHGTVGTEQVETNARGRVLRILERTDPVSGKNLHLNIDARVQQVAYDALAGQKGAVVAIEPATGAVRAMVSVPGYDSNLFVGGISSKDYKMLRNSPDRPLYDRVLQGMYPPGSTVKPMMALAGLFYGLVTPEDHISDPGFFTLPGDSRQYRDWKRGGHGWVDMKVAIVQSCDTYFYRLGQRMNIDRMADFNKHFSLGSPTGIDTINERSGILPSREWKRRARNQPWYPGETISASIGQGYTLMTPVQMAVMTATIANRGKQFAPQIVAKIGDKPVTPRELGHVELPDKHWDAVFDGMRDVVHGPRGTAKGIVKGLKYTIAGKTGTAQVVGMKQGEKYDINKVPKQFRDHALFVAFAPIEDPRLAIGIIVENGEHGSTTAAPIARQVFDAYLLNEEGELITPVPNNPMDVQAASGSTGANGQSSAPAVVADDAAGDQE